jgi:hypothetical protein
VPAGLLVSQKVVKMAAYLVEKMAVEMVESKVDVKVAW